MEKSVKRGLQKGKPSENVTRAKKISVGRNKSHEPMSHEMFGKTRCDAQVKY
jgi:hypothetical protein